MDTVYQNMWGSEERSDINGPMIRSYLETLPYHRQLFEALQLHDEIMARDAVDEMLDHNLKISNLYWE